MVVSWLWVVGRGLLPVLRCPLRGELAVGPLEVLNSVGSRGSGSKAHASEMYIDNLLFF
jgi:hypothetical protein